MSDEIARFVRELFDAWNAHDVERAASLFAPNFEGVDVAEAAPQHGRDGVRETMARYLRAFPDLHLTPDGTVVQDTQVVLMWTARGTHRGPLMNIPPTGRMVEVRGMSLLTVEGNEARQGTNLWDVAGLLRSIGLLPEL